MPYSKNSHSTPTVIEKQNATKDTYSGDKRNFSCRLRVRISISEKPKAAHTNPLVVCSITSQ